MPLSNIRPVQRRAVLTLSLAATLAVAEPALACKCVPQTQSELKRLHASSAAAFSGRLVRVDLSAGGSRATYTFSVRRAYKGRLGRRVAVRARVDAAACGLEGLPRDRDVALYLLRRRSGFESNRCLWTTPRKMRAAAGAARAASAPGCSG